MVEDAEAAVAKDTEQYLSISSKKELDILVSQGRETQQTIGDFHQTVKDYFTAQQSVKRSE